MITVKMKILIAIASLFALGVTGQVQAKNCGGLNEKSCWNPNPAKWCEGDLKYKPSGVPGKGKCVKRKSSGNSKCGGLNQSSCWGTPAQWCKDDLQYKPSGIPGKGKCVSRKKGNCGNLDQKSCWHVRPDRWCNGDLKYKPTGVPGKGTCVLRVSDNDLREVAESVVDRLKEIGDDNPLANLRTCLKRPENQAKLLRALNKKTKNGVNGILKGCKASPDALANFASDVLGSFNGAAATRTSTRSRDGDSVNLAISGVASGGVAVGAEGGIGYRIELRGNPEGRFFIAGGLSTGFGLSAGADVSVGLSYGSMPTKHWAREGGVSVSYSGKAVYGGGVAIDFNTDSIVPAGFTLSGGIGAGVEAGVVTGSVTQYLYNH